MQSVRRKSLKQLQLVVINVIIVLIMNWVWYMMSVNTIRGAQLIKNKRNRKKLRLKVMYRLIQESNVHCKSELRVNRKIFGIICEILKEIGGLSRTKNMSLEEIVAMFMYTLAHHKKNRSIAYYFIRSRETDSSIQLMFEGCTQAS